MQINMILSEIEQYTSEVNPELKKYIGENIFPQYEKK